MTPEIVVIAVLALAATAAVMLAFARGELLARLRDQLGVRSDRELETAARRAVDGRAEAEWTAQQRAGDLGYLADMVSLGIVRLDDRLVVRLANQAAHLLLRRRPGSMIGRSLLEAFGDHRVEAIVTAARETGSATDELTLREAGEPQLVVRARRSPVEGIWLVLEDVSELRRLQQIRAEFVDNLSHELRTPLTTVRLLTETITKELEHTEVPQRIRQGILEIDVETGHLVQMVNELLDLAKIEQGSVGVVREEVDIGAVMQASLERLRPFAQRQSVALELDLHPDLPRIRGDDERLGQLLINLLHNAVKFSPPESAVIVHGHLVGDEVVISVEDHGVGIPRADLERIFERFYKVDRARVRGKGGTGLGLAIARHIAEGHGGRIWVESREGAGSTFRVAIPSSAAAEMDRVS
jgi:two-component system phosphate regulon sensor histidine kinase PhoR